MKKVLTVSLLALTVSHSALAANYALNNDRIALSFDDANAAAMVRDIRSGQALSPQELFFLTLPDETKSTRPILKFNRLKKRMRRLSFTTLIRTLMSPCR